MEHVKRLEIIIDAPELPTLLALLRAKGVSGYTVISPVTGTGGRGERRNDEPGGGSGNACVITAVPTAQAMEVVESIRPILKRRGGICLITDAQSVIH